jgi:hypothetical protein
LINKIKQTFNGDYIISGFEFRKDKLKVRIKKL